MADWHGITWVQLIVSTMRELSGEAHLSQIYEKIRGHPKTRGNAWWREAVRLELRRRPTIFQPVGRKRSGRYRLMEDSFRAPADLPASSETAFDEPTSLEGKRIVRQHKSYERSLHLREEKIKRALKEHGELQCEVCAFVFADAYGPLGDGFIECHHTIPVPQLGPGQKTTLPELALVCSNCHSMLHKGGLLPVEELRVAVRRNRNQK